MMGGGIRFGTYNLYTGNIEIVVEPTMFVSGLEKALSMKSFSDYLNMILRHESIHREQEKRNTVGSKHKARFEITPDKREYWRTLIINLYVHRSTQLYMIYHNIIKSLL